MIELREVTKTFTEEKAVDQLALTVKKGSIFGLLGSNGAGKTTLLKIIAGIYRPDAGKVLIGGQSVYEQPEVKQYILFMPDTPYFFPQATIRQMARFYRSIYPSWSEERYIQLTEIFKLDPKRKLHRFSKGMKRQAAFLLALSCMPELLILDEPIDGLDPVMRRMIKNLLFQETAAREMTVVISSHNLREIEDMCDHVGIMHQGRMLLEKEVDDLKSDTHKVQVAFRDSTHEEAVCGQLSVVHKERRGSVLLLIIRGERERIAETIEAYEPHVFDLLPLTLEEIFIYEMEDAGYDIQPILL
ncbi:MULTISPECIES: ABC transporter ATP-binding protein [Paenibacillus]|uniref:ABC transporter ATP-binding protein n=1 Tax=Paenibacillus TaxID=44249 RepID=UPI0008FAF5DA|nr:MULTISPECIES: ABC transporter ATP-binding protein [Paenibacillus]APB77265.1 spermidine/putrescine ABC transporter ATP-binding protein PotA [Paenibacillus polymyxa]OMF82970.1 ABC transporter [Paenibacillus peoriae]POR25048.1 ABC transporter ATP-binding protein [Paenibacillus polymyxa]